MIKRTPQLEEALMMARHQYQNGPAVSNEGDVLAGANRQQAASDLNNESKQFGLTMGKKRLAQQGSQFGRGLAMRRDEFNTNENLSDIANVISVGNVGLSGYGLYRSGKQAEQQMAKRQELIDKIRKRGDMQSQFYADYLSLL